MISLPSTLFGVIFGGGIVAWGVLTATNRWEIFLSLSSAQIVLGGTLTAAFIGYRWRYILLSLYAIPKIFIRQKITPKISHSRCSNACGLGAKSAKRGHYGS